MKTLVWIDEEGLVKTAVEGSEMAQVQTEGVKEALPGVVLPWEKALRSKNVAVAAAVDGELICRKPKGNLLSAVEAWGWMDELECGRLVCVANDASADGKAVA